MILERFQEMDLNTLWTGLVHIHLFIQEKENHRESELIHKTERDALFGFLNLKVNFIYL